MKKIMAVACAFGLVAGASAQVKQVQLTEAAKNFLTDKGYDPQYGARPLKRAIQRYVEDALAEVVIRGETESRKHIRVDYEEGDSLTIQLD